VLDVVAARYGSAMPITDVEFSVTVEGQCCDRETGSNCPRFKSDEVGPLIGRTELTFDSAKGQLMSLKVASTE
jgi:hypothetical protein